jgi:hypothetical protein
MVRARFAGGCILTVFLLLASSIVWADLVVTKDGREYEGTIISEDKKELVIRIGEREITIAVEDVKKVTYREEPAEKTVKERAVDPDLLEKFYAQSLSITSGARGIGYGSGTAGSGGFSGGFASGSWVIWKGYHGVTKVSEAEFFRAAGRDDLAEKAVTYRSRARKWLIFGGVGFLGGVGMAVGGMHVMPLLIAGVITSNVGFWSGAFLGLIRLLKNAVDINTAAGVARVYNEKLLDELGINVPLSEIKPQF